MGGSDAADDALVRVVDGGDFVMGAGIWPGEWVATAQDDRG